MGPWPNRNVGAMRQKPFDRLQVLQGKRAGQFFDVTHESPYFRILDRHQARVHTVFGVLMNWVMSMSTQFFLISDPTCIVGHIAITLGRPTSPLCG